MKRTVVISLLGTTLDRGKGPGRWDHWRPTVSLGQHDDLLINRLELLRQDKHADTAQVVANDLKQVSPETDVRQHRIEYADPWDFEEVYTTLLDFAKSYPFDVDHEDYLVHITTGTHVMQICLFLLVESRIIPAKLIQTGIRGKGDVTGTYSIIDLDLSKYDAISKRFEVVKSQGQSFLKAGIATHDAGFNRLIERIEKVCAVSDAPILLTGASGVGKTRLARLIYEWKKKNYRVTGKFVEVNCATLKGDAALSALFGHRKGAYTGAQDSRTGLMALADGGLLFLDEIEALGLDEQAVILRALEEKRFYPLGSDTEVTSDFQLICGTNRDLAQMVAEGKFRQDMLARIELWSFDLPGLKDRIADFEPNLDYELARVSNELGRGVTFNREARTAFLNFAKSPQALWTGNFRDLAGAVTRLAVMSEAGRITEPLVAEECERLTAKWDRIGNRQQTGVGGNASSNRAIENDRELLEELLGKEDVGELDDFDVVQLSFVVRMCRESKTISEAGRRIFSQSIAKRTTVNDSDRLRKYLAKFGLTWKDIVCLSS